ncbi:MAG: AMP-binding protein [Treponema sp.]|nr:AMP-binding protein [Treponema sp.]
MAFRLTGIFKAAAGNFPIKTPFFWLTTPLFAFGIFCLFSESGSILKLYPILMNLMFLFIFGITLFMPTSIIFRFAVLMDKSIPSSPWNKKIAEYCRKVTIVWCCFFILNGSFAAYTVFFGSDTLWTIYNGGIVFVLMGLIFAIEYIIRKIIQKKTHLAVPLSAFKKNSRNPWLILCYKGAWGEKHYKTWKDFIKETAKLRKYINQKGLEKKRWLLYSEDCWYFLIAFTALLQCKKEILLSANISQGYIAEIRGSADGIVPFLTDQTPAGEQDFIHIPAVLADISVKHSDLKEVPAINADETSIIMYTSGSTGEPKAIKQRLTEFEKDNSGIISLRGEEFLKRKTCSTVSHHHMYGLLYSILLPFTIGVPFRRKMIDFPGELENLTCASYMFVSSPAFLKRAVKNETPFTLKSPWIFSSGGLLEHKTAEKTNDVLGFWPIEGNGSTETSGVAWRQSCKGPEWTPLDTVQLSQAEDGCLIVRSPYIKDMSGFKTSDMIELLSDGRFLLKGRIDSVVKIEEKRISLTEIENRIMQSGYAEDVCVISMEGSRQYLAAVIVFNNEGIKKFEGLEKNLINKFWREYLSQYLENVVIPKRWQYPKELPVDTQGKKRKEDMILLFSEEIKGESLE